MPANAPPPPHELMLTDDGIWTWFTDPRARVAGGHLFTMAVDSVGSCRIHRTDLSSLQTCSALLSAEALERDDHNNGAVNVLSDGRLLVTYGKHNDGVVRYRVSDHPHDITAWSPERHMHAPGGPFSYPNMFRFESRPDEWWLFTRRGGGGRPDVALAANVCVDVHADGDVAWRGMRDVWRNPGCTPYWRLCHNGHDRLHVVTTDLHPQQGHGRSSLFHFSLTVDPQGVLRRWRSDGVEIQGEEALNPSDLTLIHDGTVERCWVSDVALDPQGRPRALWMKYPHNDGRRIEYWHARWTGSQWQSNFIVDGGRNLYENERFYHGGLCFDAEDINRIYLSAPIEGEFEIQAWRGDEDGERWHLDRQITRNCPVGMRRIRPFSPIDHRGRVPVLWVEGRYTTYRDFKTSLRGLVVRPE